MFPEKWNTERDEQQGQLLTKMKIMHTKVGKNPYVAIQKQKKGLKKNGCVSALY